MVSLLILLRDTIIIKKIFHEQNKCFNIDNDYPISY